jgi:hypothetical protein
MFSDTYMGAVCGPYNHDVAVGVRRHAVPHGHELRKHAVP